MTISYKRILALFAAGLLTASLLTACGDKAQKEFEQGMLDFKGSQFVNAAEHFERAANMGHAEAQYQTGKCYENGHGVMTNIPLAVKWYRMAAEQGHLEAMLELASLYRSDIRGLKKDMNEAVKWYRKAAEKGSDKAMFELGLCCMTGDGMEKNAEEAVGWWRKAAEIGNRESMYNLGMCYRDGRGVEKDMKEAVKWWRKAAEKGFTQAYGILGACYMEGTGVEKDEEEAVKWWRKAAEKGEALAMRGLAECYEKGIGVNKDMGEAVKWYLKAADEFDRKALYSSSADDIKKNWEYAVKSLQGAARLGERGSMFKLGSLYEEGLHGVDSDLLEAVKWYRMAAEKGDEAAISKLKGIAASTKEAASADTPEEKAGELARKTLRELGRD